MAILVTTLIGILLGGGIPLLITHVNHPLFIFLLIVVSLSLLSLVLIGIWRFWFSNRRWKYVTSDDKKAKGSPYFFDVSHKSPLWIKQKQETGMFFELNLGREYKIKEVNFDCGNTSDAPLESNITFINKHNGWPLLEKTGCPYIKLPLKDDEFRSTTRVRLNTPIKAQRIRIEVIRPDIESPWRVNAVYVTIKTWFGYRHTIGKCFLDKL